MLFDPDQTVSPVAPAYCTVLQEFLESSSASYVRAEAVIDNLNRNTLGLPMFRHVKIGAMWRINNVSKIDRAERSCQRKPHRGFHEVDERQRRLSLQMFAERSLILAMKSLVMLSSPMQLTSDNPTSLSFKGKSPLPFGDVGRPAVVDSDFFRLEECCLTVRPGSASSKLIDEFVTADLDAGMVTILLPVYYMDVSPNGLRCKVDDVEAFNVLMNLNLIEFVGKCAGRTPMEDMREQVDKVTFDGDSILWSLDKESGAL
ncbi:unnamed protein product [Heligmosomoides polygyrus]|uniref:RNase_Zc3h12a_2 domain-containing protein n=1 Tax=Heligmosomoides polygyrus TaxID=6339 RepID=A0A183GQA4_HELPZ|nr:unnamed protein product [Heligmosomoides polygyrus]